MPPHHARGRPESRAALALTPALAIVSTPLGVAVFIVVWAGAGLSAAILLSRRGHDLQSLAGLALVLGPFFIPLALHMVRRREPTARSIHLVPSAPRHGRRIVIGLLGAPEAAADALPVLRSFGDLGSVTLAVPIDYEAADRATWDDVKRAAEQRLSQAATLLSEFEPGQVLVPGPPEQALAGLVTSREDIILLVSPVGAEIRHDRLSAVTGVAVVAVPPSGGATS
jgi:hypothetical protein